MMNKEDSFNKYLSGTEFGSHNYNWGNPINDNHDIISGVLNVGGVTSQKNNVNNLQGYIGASSDRSNAIESSYNISNECTLVDTNYLDKAPNNQRFGSGASGDLIGNTFDDYRPLSLTKHAKGSVLYPELDYTGNKKSVGCLSGDVLRIGLDRVNEGSLFTMTENLDNLGYLMETEIDSSGSAKTAEIWPRMGIAQFQDARYLNDVADMSGIWDYSKNLGIEGDGFVLNNPRASSELELYPSNSKVSPHVNGTESLEINDQTHLMGNIFNISDENALIRTANNLNEGMFLSDLKLNDFDSTAYPYINDGVINLQILDTSYSKEVAIVKDHFKDIIGGDANWEMLNNENSLFGPKKVNNLAFYGDAKLNGSGKVAFPDYINLQNEQFYNHSVGNFNYESNYGEVRELATQKIEEMIKESINVSTDKVSIKSMIQIVDDNGFKDRTIFCVVNLINVEGEVSKNTINLFGGGYDV